MIRLGEIEHFFENYDYQINALVLDDCTKITDLKKFVDMNISILKNNSGNPLFAPYFVRLKKVYLIIKKQCT